MATDDAPIRAHELSARQAALELIAAALERRNGLQDGLDRPAFKTLATRERALARMIAMTVLRRMGGIDLILKTRLSKPTPTPIMMLLRLGAAQILYMETPAFAAVDTTVRMAGRERATRPFKGLINAVLRGLTREPPTQPDDAAWAPDWLFARWRAAFGEADARAIARMIPEEPSTDATPRSADDPDLAEMLEATALPGGTLRVGLRGDVAVWPGFAEGRWWVQDAASAIPARLLHLAPGETALDLCAAPGGKCLQLAAAGAKVTALDRSAKRLERLKRALARTGLAAEQVAVDAAAWRDERLFDAVLLDAPCSATGTFRRRPDVLWASRPADIAKLAAVQSRLLDAAAAKLSPGGRLVYCVCSLEPEEGERQIEALLRRTPLLRLDPIAASEGGAPEAAATPEGWLRILPHQRPSDGFFAARLVHATSQIGWRRFKAT